MNKANQLLHSALRGALILSACFVARTATADIFVDMATTPLGGGIFQYDFSVENSGPDDVVLVTITDAPLADPLIDPTLVAPADFLAFYDPGLGFVDFLEFTGSFVAGQTIGGFQFQSEATPPAYFTAFEALTVNGDSIRGSINLRGVPETGSTLLMAGLGLTALASAHRKLSRG